MITVSITIDAAPNFESLIRDKVKYFQAELNSFCKEQDRQNELENLVQSAAFLKRRYKKEPVVLAKIYGTKTTDDLIGGFRRGDYSPAYDIDWRAFINPGNVPVYMRGSRHMRKLRNGPAGDSWNGYQGQWIEDIIHRYLRRRGFTSFSRDEIRKTISYCVSKYSLGMHHKTRDALYHNLGLFQRHRFCYIKGIPMVVDDKNQWSLIKHLEKVERKIAGVQRGARQ